MPSKINKLATFISGVWTRTVRTLTAPTNLTNDDAVINNSEILDIESDVTNILTDTGTTIPATITTLNTAVVTDIPATINENTQTKRGEDTYSLTDDGSGTDVFSGTGGTTKITIPATFHTDWTPKAHAKIHFEADLSLLVAGDIVELHIKKKQPISAGYNQFAKYIFSGVLKNPSFTCEIDCTTDMPIIAYFIQTATGVGSYKVIEGRFWAVGQNEVE